MLYSLRIFEKITSNNLRKKAMKNKILSKAILALTFSSLLLSTLSAETVNKRMSIKVAKKGFPYNMAQTRATNFNLPDLLKGEDTMMYTFLHMSQFLPTTIIAHSSPVMPLAKTPRPEVGKVKFASNLGKLSLDEYLAHPESYVQGYLVIHKGKIVYEKYPGMKETDSHVWASNGKVLTSLVIALLAQEGKIDINKTIGFYMPDFKGTVWQDIPVIDVLDMATGTDFVENDETRSDPNSAATRIFQAIMGVKSANGKLEHHTDVLKSAKKIGPSGHAFEYGSGVTQMLVLLAEEVKQKHWSDIFEERVWSKMGVESDLQVPLTPDGIAAVQGTVSSRLRDLGRFGMLYAPSWNKASHEQIVSKKILSDIQNGCRPEIYNKGHMGPAMTKHFKEKPKCNGWQWDAIFDDGDIYKSGLMGQGLYVSPSRDLVVVWFSADKAASITGYSRAIATSGLFK